MKADLDKLRELAARGESISCGCMLLRSIVEELDHLRKIEAAAIVWASADDHAPVLLECKRRLFDLVKGRTP